MRYSLPWRIILSLSVIFSLILFPVHAGPFLNTPDIPQQKDALQDIHERVMDSAPGRMPVSVLVRSLSEMTGGGDIQTARMALALRKAEALPLVKENLRIGDLWEKHALAKFLQASPWPETAGELLSLALDSGEHWLPRQSALYALGFLGDTSAGPALAAILSEPECPAGVRLAAMAALARLGCRDAVEAILPFAADEDIHTRLFAQYALARFGKDVDRDFLISALGDEDYLVRAEACEALAAAGGEDAVARLRVLSEGDPHQAVRIAAAKGRLSMETRDQPAAAKLDILKNALGSADRFTATWILRETLDACGEEGRAFLISLAGQEDAHGRAARNILVMKDEVLRTMTFPERNRALPDCSINLAHMKSPTHYTLIEYASEKAAELPAPVIFTASQKSRMREGVYDEDNGIRSANHAFNPISYGAFPTGTVARDEALTRWNSMTAAFVDGNLDGGDGDGAWHFSGRLSHILQDMTSPLHVLAVEHIPPRYCQFEVFWEDEDPALRTILNGTGAPLHSGDPLPAEALAQLDTFSQLRLQHRFENNCPGKAADDPRGWLEVLAWITWFRTTFWGEVNFGSSGSSDGATSSLTTATTFKDGTVSAKPNVLHTMFNGDVRWIATLTDNYYEITDRRDYVFRWMSWSDLDDWSACGAYWGDDTMDGSRKSGGSNYDSRDVRITGRFWFDLREIGSSSSGDTNRNCYPHRYPNGDSMTDHLHQYFGKTGYPLTIRYNAGLLGLAYRHVQVKTNMNQANGFGWGRKDNFGNGPSFNGNASGSSFYFAAKSPVTLTAPQSDASGNAFVRWLKNGEAIATNRTITINTATAGIPPGGSIFVAEYSLPSVPPSVSIPPAIGCFTENAEIPFILYDSQSRPTNIHVQFSLDGGVTWNWAYTTRPLDQCMRNLAASPEGVQHAFPWYSQKQATCDLYENTRIRILPYNSGGNGVWTSSGDICLDNLLQLPRVAVYSPTDAFDERAFIPIYYQIFDCQSEATSIHCKYSKDGGATWNWAYGAPGGHGLTNLASSPAGTVRMFLWDAAANLGSGTHPNVQFSILPYNTKGMTGFWKSPVFEVKNALGPWVNLYAPAAPVAGAGVTLWLHAFDHKSLPVNISAWYSTDGGRTWSAAQTADGSNVKQNLAATRTGVAGSYLWEAGKDLGAGTFAVTFGLRAYNDANGQGEWSAVSFTIRTD